MPLREQHAGNQKPWTLDELRVGLEHFKKEHGHYPTATEVDGYKYLPSARSIERSFGGLVKLRSTLRLDTDNDLRKGEHSSQRAHHINDRAHKMEQYVYEFLTNRYGKEFVHREYFFSDDQRTRADFFVYDNHEGFCVDVFYPSTRRNLSGCLNLKIKKYDRFSKNALPYPIIFLQMNPNMRQEVLDNLLMNKEKKLTAKQSLMGWDSFEAFCSKRSARRR
jgi:hypothetical protein